MKKKQSSMMLVARAFAYVARIIRDHGRRRDRAHVQSTWKVLPVGSSWERRDGSIATMQPRDPRGSRAQRRMPNDAVATGRQAGMSSAVARALALAAGARTPRG